MSILKTLVSFLVLSALIVFASPLWSSLFGTKPCEEPVAYTLGQFDREFNMSQKEFLEALAEAEQIWEGPSGRDLFAHNPQNADLRINLIYDYRQAATEELTVIESEVEQDEASYRALEGKYFVAKQEYENIKLIYEGRVTSLQEQREEYENRVEDWNSGDRTSKAEFNALESERKKLESEVENVRRLEVTFNQKVIELNTLVERLNKLAKELNLNAEQYNSIGASRGETFEGGVYYSGADGVGINIYEFSTREKLVRILAHELGHALGLEHIDDSDAIMYRLNEGDAGGATQADLEQLNLICATT